MLLCNYQNLNPLGNEGGGTLANFSTYGPTIDGRLKPEISAPGVSVESSMNSFTDASFNATEEVEFNGVLYPFAKLSGTSMSGPAVAGIVALMLQANPELTIEEVREALQVTAREDDHTGVIPATGRQIPDSVAALDGWRPKELSIMSLKACGHIADMLNNIEAGMCSKHDNYVG